MDAHRGIIPLSNGKGVAILCPQGVAKDDARGGRQIDPDDFNATIARLQKIAAEDRDRVSWRARQAAPDVERALTPAN